MKQGKVIVLAEYKALSRLKAHRLSRAGGERFLPNRNNLWELLDRNISLDVWQRSG